MKDFKPTPDGGNIAFTMHDEAVLAHHLNAYLQPAGVKFITRIHTRKYL